tara:strand:- start:640 stop:1101 length:462 start_codon:yes stop_codon:yes gene_type:complete
MKKNIIILIFYSLTLFGCGYTPMNSKKDNFNFIIVALNLEGDTQINNIIEKELNRRSKTEIGKKYKVEINTNYSKTSVLKDTKGNTTEFKLSTYLSLNISNEINKNKRTIILTESFTMKKNDNNFDQKNYERSIKNNMATSLTEKIIFQLLKN